MLGQIPAVAEYFTAAAVLPLALADMEVCGAATERKVLDHAVFSEAMGDYGRIRPVLREKDLNSPGPPGEGPSSRPARCQSAPGFSRILLCRNCLSGSRAVSPEGGSLLAWSKDTNFMRDWGAANRNYPLVPEFRSAVPLVTHNPFYSTSG